MDSQETQQPIPVTEILQSESPAHTGIWLKELGYFHIVGGLLLASVTVYGFLTSNEPPLTEAHTAAVSSTSAAFDSLTLKAQGVFVADLSENTVIFARNADVQLPLASLTKIALIIAVSEVLENDERIHISPGAALRGEGGLTAGEIWRAQDLIDYTLVASSNAGAEALAEAADKRLHARYPESSEEHTTVWRMNEIARELGLSKTYFLNPSGLDVSPTQPSAMGSARDATILLAFAYKTRPQLFEATAQKTLALGPIGGPSLLTQNTNEAIGSIPGLIMGKTGFTDLAGGNVSIVFESEPARPLVATVLGSTQDGRFTDILAITAAAER